MCCTGLLSTAQSPIVFLSMLFCLFLWQRKAGLLMMDHASLFTEIVHPYLPKLYITIYQLSYIAIYRLHFYSLLATCKNYHVTPTEWMQDVLTRIAGYPINKIQELLPQNWKPTQSE